MKGGFGTPASIDPAVVARLPLAMQREAALMLLDMGLTPNAARRHIGLAPGGFDALLDSRPAPFKRGGELILAGDHE
jgi:hypothetical protein